MCTRAVYATAEGPSPREGPVATSVLSRLRSHNFIFDFAIRTRNCCLASALAGPGRRSSSRDGDRDETAGTHATRYPEPGRAGDVSRRVPAEPRRIGILRGARPKTNRPEDGIGLTDSVFGSFAADRCR